MSPDPGRRGRVENYTGPFLVAAGVLAFVALLAIWALWGLGATLLAALSADRLIAAGRPRP